MIEKMYDLNNLYDSFQCVKAASGWKETVQRYDENVMFNLIELKNKLMDGGYKPQKPIKFLLTERGKTRCIESYGVEDRIVQNCFMNNVLLPVSQPKLIYDNSASIKGKGTDFFRARFIWMLKQHMKEHGEEGYILLGDMSKYFDNIQHEKWLNELSWLGLDDESLDFVHLLLENHVVDVSYMTNEEYANCMDTLFDSVQYMRIPNELKTGEKLMEKSIGIGAPIAQGAGITHLCKLDNLCKIVLGHKYYSRYQDDFQIIHHDKECLKYSLERTKEQCADLGVFLNCKKTQIVKLSHKFTLLKTQYRIRNSKVWTFPTKDTIKREKSHLKGLKQDMERGKITKASINKMYVSWRGAFAGRFGNCKTLGNIDIFCNSLFGGDVEPI